VPSTNGGKASGAPRDCLQTWRYLVEDSHLDFGVKIEKRWGLPEHVARCVQHKYLVSTSKCSIFLTLVTGCKWDIDDKTVTVQNLLHEKVIELVHNLENDMVLPKEVYPMYEYVQMGVEKLDVLLRRTTEHVTYEQYVSA
jgi:hypothetical protein